MPDGAHIRQPVCPIRQAGWMIWAVRHQAQNRRYLTCGFKLHGCKRAKRAKRAERRARLDCNSHKTCQNLHIRHAKICTQDMIFFSVWNIKKRKILQQKYDYATA